VSASEDRERLIEIGLDVCLRRGYEKTTLGDVAAVAGVSEKALAAEFASTEAIVMAPVDAMLAAVAVAVADIDPQVQPVDALQAAPATVLHDIIEGVGPISRDRMQAMGNVIMKSPQLQEHTSAHRKEVLSELLAERLDVEPRDPSITRAVATWSAVVAATYVAAPDKHGKFEPRDDAQRPDRMRDRLKRAFGIITGR
jgi:AcrR family transcriptional regulator